jgi:hypothetical protein
MRAKWDEVLMEMVMRVNREAWSFKRRHGRRRFQGFAVLAFIG